MFYGSIEKSDLIFLKKILSIDPRMILVWNYKIKITEKWGAFLTTALQQYIASRVKVKVDGNIIDNTVEGEPSWLLSIVLWELLEGNRSELLLLIVLRHDFEVLVVGFAVFADSLHALCDDCGFVRCECVGGGDFKLWLRGGSGHFSWETSLKYYAHFNFSNQLFAYYPYH